MKKWFFIAVVAVLFTAAIRSIASAPPLSVTSLDGFFYGFLFLALGVWMLVEFVVALVALAVKE